jgi:hypothetical protein
LSAYERRFEAFAVGSLPPMKSRSAWTFLSKVSLALVKFLISCRKLSITVSFSFACMREKLSSKPVPLGVAGELDLDLFESLEAAGEPIECFLCGGGDENCSFEEDGTASFACALHH